LKYFELQTCSRHINQDLHWSQKDEYFELIEDFLSFKINGKKFERLKSIKPSGIYFDEKDPPDFPFAKNEEDFRNAVSDIFLQLQKC